MLSARRHISTIFAEPTGPPINYFFFKKGGAQFLDVFVPFLSSLEEVISKR